MSRHQTFSSRHVRRTAAAAAGVTTFIVASLVTLPAASADVPTFPDNVVVFPDRDFVSVEGYGSHAGETATLEVSRNGTVMGSAESVVSDSGVAFEVNHPGGVCWGNGTSLKVTPDIRAGDVVTIRFPDGSHDETTTSSATVTSDLVQSGSTITVKGIFGPEVNPDFMEQRIINADLVDVIGKRDVRALPGPLVPAPRGGYSSGMEVDTATHTFVATYEFDTQQGADTAAAADLGERAMNWQVQDADGNRQGLTIAEFGEPGGPGVGGCPPGPANQDSPVGAAVVVRSVDKTSATVRWTAVTPQPGADPVTGYAVVAVGGTVGGAGQLSTLGKRTDASATQSTINGLDPAENYSFEVRSQSGLKMSAPFSMSGGPTDTTPPTLTMDPAPTAGVVQTSSVTLGGNGQIFYTTDGSPAIANGDTPADNAVLYTGPIPVTDPVTIRAASFDQAGNFVLLEGDFAPSPLPALPGAPTGLAGTPTQNSVALTWNPSGETTVTDYQVKVLDASGAPLANQPPLTAVPRQTITGLNPGTAYGFRVAAKNAAGLGAASDAVTVSTQAAADRITISSAKWKAGDFRVVGTGDNLGATVQVYRVNADGTPGAAITGMTAQVVAAAPPGIGDYSIRARTNVPTTNPGRIIVKSTGGGVAGPFTVSNG